ncbi:MAG: hypothetical protein R8K21_05945 [Mariprofundales bacterium]
MFDIFANPGRIKLTLVSHGVRLPENGLPEASRWVSQANSSEHLLDMRLPSGHFASVPIGQPYTENSPLALYWQDGKAHLRAGKQSMPVSLLPAPLFYQQNTRLGARMGAFSALHDRLLVLQPRLGCGFFANADMQQSLSCQYCHYESILRETNPPLRDSLELVEVVRAALRERQLDTVYLYNGFALGDDSGLGQLVPIIALLRKHLGIQRIALETVAVRDTSVLTELYAAGLDIFVCNLELQDADTFARICPGKQSYGGQEAVWQTLHAARAIFREGHVASNIIVGLEDISQSKKAISSLINSRIVPLLQPFRPLPETPLEHTKLPALEELETLFLHMYQQLEQAQLVSNRLRDMGRVFTPMESRALIGNAVTLSERWQLWTSTSPIGRRVEGLVNDLRRHLRVHYDNNDKHDGLH